jgi:hypothetical protein
MNMEDEEYSPFGGYTTGCDIHGEDFLRECTMCGIEFCSACFPQSALCSDCAAQGDLDDDEEEPTEEEKELLLLEGFNDDEPAEMTEALPSPPPAAKHPASASKAKEKRKTPAVKKAQPKSTAKDKGKLKKPVRIASKAKGKAKPHKPAPSASKTRAKAKAQKKR